jgi:hypothetical protein
MRANQTLRMAILLNLAELMPCQINMVKIKIGIRHLGKPRIDSNSDNYFLT